MRMTDRQIEQLNGLTDKQFKVKYGIGKKKKKKVKSKKQRQAWWNNLSQEQKSKQIDKWKNRQKRRRIQSSIDRMKTAKVKHECSTCFHCITENCITRLKHGCEYWFNPNSNIQGLAYKFPRIDKTNRAEWLKQIKKLNPWLRVA